ncbi:MAG: flavodoxin domain protein [Deltaproteobacteria bacterium]|nr:flavodoxin domain protein [Deltaproteobacteria bacterium]
MSRVLLLYASHYGHTRRIADRLAQLLRERDHQVDVVDVRTGALRLPAPERYDVVVLGSRVEFGRHATDLIEYIRIHREALSRMPTAFFSVSMAASGPAAGADPSAYLAAMFEDLGWYPAQAISLAGGLPYRRYGWIMRFVMKRIARGAGHTTDTSRNHDFTDWNAVASFADKIEYIAGGSARREARTHDTQQHTN